MSTTTTIHGREYTTLAGLLDLAHKDGLSAIETRVLSLPHENAMAIAIVQATVTTSQGTFQAVGDATEDNVGNGIEPHLVRMAETRAIARALRWATNSASTAEEEIAPQHPVHAFEARFQAAANNGGNGNGHNGGDRRVTSRQIALITRLLREGNLKQEIFRQQVSERFDGRALEDLTTKEASTIIEELMQAA